MRVLKFIFTSLIILFVIGFGGSYIAREFILTMGVTNMKNSLRQVAGVAKNSGTYAAECRKKGIIELDESSIKTIQLRFTSDTEYQIEVICRQFSLDPIIVDDAELPRFVRKTDGFSGIVWGEDLSGVSIESFGKKKSVYVEDFSIYLGTLEDVQGSIGPLTSCSGHGYTCCSPDTTIGVGEQLTRVSDCPQTCFEKCVNRPVVLSVSTQPFFDLKTRVLTVNKGEQVIVAYVIDPADSKELSVSIDFGDGQTEQLSEFSGDVVHQYDCDQFSCSYDLQVTAVNEKGIEAAQTSITRVRVIVQ